MNIRQISVPACFASRQQPRVFKCSRYCCAIMCKSYLRFPCVRMLTVSILTFRHRRLSSLLCCSPTHFTIHSLLFPFQLFCINLCSMLVAFLPTDVFFTLLKAIKPLHKELSCKDIVLDSCSSRVHQLYVSLPVHETTSFLQITSLDRFSVLLHQLFTSKRGNKSSH